MYKCVCISFIRFLKEFIIVNKLRIIVLEIKVIVYLFFFDIGGKVL